MGQVPGASDIEHKYEYWINFGIKTEQERILKAILNEAYSVSHPMMVDKEYLDGLERAIDLITGENK